MKIVIYGLTITSSWGNGHATTYRSLLKALAARGHSIIFVEKDVEWYRNNRDMPKPEFCSVRFYEQWKGNETAILSPAFDADVIVVGSYFTDAIDVTKELLGRVDCPILFYDIDTPVTLHQLRSTGFTDYLSAALIREYSAYLSFTGGPALRQLIDEFGARMAFPFYCSVDPGLYHPTATQAKYECQMSYLGTYSPDRQQKLMYLLNDTAAKLPQSRFLVAGPLYPRDTEWQPNVEHVPHVAPPDHPCFYSSCRFTLNLTRADMVAAGYSPSVRLFEASACGAAILSDAWPGLETLLKPGDEILLPRSSEEVLQILTHVSDEERKRMGARARERILAEHTSEHRAMQFERIVAECVEPASAMKA